jgi:hypothetical protein
MIKESTRKTSGSTKLGGWNDSHNVYLFRPVTSRRHCDMTMTGQLPPQRPYHMYCPHRNSQQLAELLARAGLDDGMVVSIFQILSTVARVTVRDH